MKYTLTLQSEAVIDIQEAFDWYERQQSGLGFELLSEIERGFAALGNHPLHYTGINEWLRRLKVNRFPYLVIYEVENENVIVISVRHMNRKPKF